MIVCLFAIVRTAAVSVVAVIARRITHESVLKWLVAFLVPLKVTDHFLFFDKNPRVAIEAVEMFPDQENVY